MSISKNFYRINPTGAKRNMILSRSWDFSDAMIYRDYLKSPAYSDVKKPDIITYVINSTSTDKDIDNLIAGHLTDPVETFIFSSQTKELIEPVTKEIFEFFPVRICKTETGYYSDNFFSVRFVTQKPFYDKSRHDEIKATEDMNKWSLVPCKRSLMDFPYACQDPDSGRILVTDKFKKLINPIVKLSYEKRPIELVDD